MVLSIILSMPFSISSKNGTQGPHGKFKLIKNRLQKLFRKIWTNTFVPSFEISCLVIISDANLISLTRIGATQSKDSDSIEPVAVIVFWCSVVICVLIGIFSSLGNGLVLYISNKNVDFGGFQEVNLVVKNLATSDFLFGVLGCPLTIVWWYWGKLIEMSI